MNKQFIFIALLIAAVVGFYNVITSVLELRAAEDEVHKAEVIVAGTEEMREEDNLQKYGCENPTVMPGLVSCP